MRPFFAYMLRCSDGSFYVGHTDELERRVVQHQRGEIEGYTSSRRPVALVWSEEFPTREEALLVELQLKGWTRAKKEALIRGDWGSIKALARGPDRSERTRRRDGSSSSPFDSGPAAGGPYAQGERGGPYAQGERGGPYAQGERGGPYAQGERDGPYAQGERDEDSPRSPHESSPRPPVKAGTDERESSPPVKAGTDERESFPVKAGTDQRTSVRPERSGRAAAAESKDERYWT